MSTETDFADFLVFSCGGCNFFIFQSSIIFCFPTETSVPIFHKYGSFCTGNHLFWCKPKHLKWWILWKQYLGNSCLWQEVVFNMWIINWEVSFLLQGFSQTYLIHKIRRWKWILCALLKLESTVKKWHLPEFCQCHAFNNIYFLYSICTVSSSSLVFSHKRFQIWMWIFS